MKITQIVCQVDHQNLAFAMERHLDINKLIDERLIGDDAINHDLTDVLAEEIVSNPKIIRALTGADLRNADLRNAMLSGADLRNADLTGANLTGATFQSLLDHLRQLRNGRTYFARARAIELKQARARDRSRARAIDFAIDQAIDQAIDLDQALDRDQVVTLARLLVRAINQAIEVAREMALTIALDQDTLRALRALRALFTTDKLPVLIANLRRSANLQGADFQDAMVSGCYFGEGLGLEPSEIEDLKRRGGIFKEAAGHLD
jgi:uncharacterized protein YjbI with pentapeptide repeats